MVGFISGGCDFALTRSPSIKIWLDILNSKRKAGGATIYDYSDPTTMTFTPSAYLKECPE
jgi:hypothetical protein